ncbi:MAG TPA: alpha/beta fold hydrolase [Fimbriimonadaceae bacterium]|nr:alpha/beta fold hydrolase [Fimbriimonadaceae bacterium]
MAVASTQRANEWVDRKEYPFDSHYLNVDGGRMHYVDEGQGPPIVFVHGNPTWSFLFRGMIRDLSLKHRCIAMDHIGFGLSEKPEHWGYSPELHARNLARLIEHLGIPKFSLVVHGFGGPIGLSYAIENPVHVDAIVAMNSWMWSLKENAQAKKFDKGVSNAFGKLNYSFTNPATILMPKAIEEKLKFPDRVYEQYKKPFANAKERQGAYGMAKGLLGSSTWQHGLWARREVLAGKAGLIVWGMCDRLFTPDLIPRWQSILPGAKVEQFPNAGHFAIEEDANAVEAAVYMFMDGQREMGGHGAAIMTFD